MTAHIPMAAGSASKRRSLAIRLFGLAWGVAAFIAVHALFVWFILFLADIGPVPSIDAPPRAGAPVALAIDAALIALFGLQHSVMARPGFKTRWTRFVPEELERATYVHAANLALALLLWLWQPVPAVLWRISDPWLQAPFWLLFVSGWALAFAGNLTLDPLELLGLRQCRAWFEGRRYEPRPFRSNWLYGRVRHPIQAGLILAFWSAPVMTVGHALLAGGLTAFILIAIRYEERDLAAVFGAPYRAYRAATPRFIPRLRSRKGAE